MRKIDDQDVAFLREIASRGPFARSENLPQGSYPSVKARGRCKAMGLVIYRKRSARKGFWYLSEEGRQVLAGRETSALSSQERP